jgi:diguanylate cyclase
VLAAHAHWDWVEEVIAAIRPPWAQGAGVELLLVSREGKVIHADGAGAPAAVPSGLVADGVFAAGAWPDGVHYGAVAAAVREPLPGQALGWRVVVRQPLERMLADVLTLKRTLIAFKLVAAGALLVLIWWGASRMSRPIEELARFSRRVEEGDPHAGLALGDGRGEVAEVQALSRAVRGMARTLIEHGQALERSNQELERKVAERTRELERLRFEAELQARTDPLTSLPNRRAFYEGAGKLLRLASRTGDPLALIMLDIDFFKRVNDTWGHDAGDRVLIEVAAQIADCARDSDLPVRLGGEEFAVLLPGTDAAGARHFAERLRQKIAALEIVVDDEVLQVTSSFGVACSAGAQADIEDLLQRSDAALYRSKAEGRNRVTVGGEAAFSG